MPKSIYSQSSTPTSLNGVNGSGNGSDSQWHIQQNVTPLQWSELPLHNVVPVSVTTSNASRVPHIDIGMNNASGLNQPVQYNPPNYINLSYQRNGIPNGYNPSTVQRGINGQAVNLPNMIRTPNGQVMGGGNWPNQSNVGRFVAQPTWTNNKPSGGVKKQKRIRTAFTSQQMMELEQEYARTRFLDRTRRIELANTLSLNERTIKIWFQNRRMKEKKDRAESLEDSEEASTSESSPDMGNIQLPYHDYQSIPNEIYNQGGVYMEQYPVSSTSSMPATSMPSTMMPQIPSTVQNVYQVPEYITDEQCQVHYGQQVHLQVQPYPSLYGNEVSALTSEAAPQAEAVSTTSAPSNIIETSWDLSWLKSLQSDDEF